MDLHTEPFRHPDGHDGLWVRVQDERGLTGWGEASPLPGYSDESLADVVPVLGEAAFRLQGWPLQSIEDVQSAVETLPPECPSGRFALETALLDLLGRQQGRSVARLLRQSADDMQRVAVNALVDGVQSNLLDQVRAARNRGIRTFKLKTRTCSFEVLLRQLRSLRETFGGTINLRLDANGRWSLEEARANLLALEPFALEYVEEPVTGLPLLALESPVPLAADESLRDPSFRRELLTSHQATHAVRVVILKPMVLGGLLRCRNLWWEAAQAGLTGVITHTMDGVVAFAATAELVASLPVSRHAYGLDLHRNVRVYAEKLRNHLRGGAVGSADRPGLGVAPQ